MQPRLERKEKGREIEKAKKGDFQRHQLVLNIASFSRFQGGGDWRQPIQKGFEKDYINQKRKKKKAKV